MHKQLEASLCRGSVLSFIIRMISSSLIGQILDCCIYLYLCFAPVICWIREAVSRILNITKEREREREMKKYQLKQTHPVAIFGSCCVKLFCCCRLAVLEAFGCRGMLGMSLCEVEK